MRGRIDEYGGREGGLQLGTRGETAMGSRLLSLLEATGGLERVSSRGGGFMSEREINYVALRMAHNNKIMQIINCEAREGVY